MVSKSDLNTELVQVERRTSSLEERVTALEAQTQVHVLTDEEIRLAEKHTAPRQMMAPGSGYVHDEWSDCERYGCVPAPVHTR